MDEKKRDGSSVKMGVMGIVGCRVVELNVQDTGSYFRIPGLRCGELMK